MRLTRDELSFSAGDLAGHLACRHRTDLDRRAVRGELEPPIFSDPRLELLQQRGLEFEEAYVDHLRQGGARVVELRDVEGATARERTLEACARGADVIVQAELGEGRWHGRADLLVRAEGASALGDWRYDVVDTKLARETRGGTLLQLCLYADLLTPIQGAPAERIAVVKPGTTLPFEREDHRFDDFQAYYRFVRRRLERFVDGRAEPPYPAPVPHCEVCRWWKRCDDRRHADDHLSLVAGLTSMHAAELERQGARTLEALAESDDPLPEPPRRGHRGTYLRLRDQAAVQLRGRRAGAPVHALLPLEEGRGLSRLPAPSEGDVFLDFEGDPYVGGPGSGGLEYLTGWAWVEGGEVRYEAVWATDRAQERRALERLLDVVLARLRAWPDLHVYHYAPYEPSALKRLVGRHATRERELDVLLRGERFVDLLSVVRGGLLASVESYSLKPLEAFFGYRREVALREEAGPALRRVALALEGGAPDLIHAEDRAAVEGYNRDDCVSLMHLRTWLEKLRTEAGVAERPPLKDGGASEEVRATADKARRVFEALVDGIPEDPPERSPEQRARWLLAHLIEYFRREDKVAWWEYFTRRDADDETLRADRKALVGLEFEREVEGGTPVCPIHRYRYPPQEVSLDEGADLRDPRLQVDPEQGGKAYDKVGTLVELDPVRRTLDVKKTKRLRDHHPERLHVQQRVNPWPLDEALLDLADRVAEGGLEDAEDTLRCARDLLLALPPRLPGAQGPLRAEGEDAIEAASRAVGALRGGVLAIQGPPGTGKTHSGARVILRLLQAGKRVGVTATSHKVIRNLLDAVLDAAAEEGDPVEATHQPSSRAPRPPEPRAGLSFASNAAASREALDEGRVVGGVAWLWAREDMRDTLDYLFVDEAGQMSLAHVLACAGAATNLVLLGDPRQLQQPQRGAHPEGAEISALDHLLGGHDTMPPDRGLFLETTWRLPPAICDFTSELYYEGRLEPREACALQRLDGPTPIRGAGLFHLPVEHEGNQSSSPEEVAAVATLVARLTDGRTRWTDVEGASRPLGPEHLLVVAPYNAQVAELRRSLPERVRVGTVDRFQGQEAPVVIYSLASSSAADAPRGMGFLYDPHRLNVATSRARCACVLVSTQALFEADCRTVDQMRWANGLARYRELATSVPLDTLG